LEHQSAGLSSSLVCIEPTTSFIFVNLPFKWHFVSQRARLECQVDAIRRNKVTHESKKILAILLLTGAWQVRLRANEMNQAKYLEYTLVHSNRHGSMRRFETQIYCIVAVGKHWFARTEADVGIFRTQREA
jgi:hypothetical protein